MCCRATELDWVARGEPVTRERVWRQLLDSEDALMQNLGAEQLRARMMWDHLSSAREHLGAPAAELDRETNRQVVLSTGLGGSMQAAAHATDSGPYAPPPGLALKPISWDEIAREQAADEQIKAMRKDIEDMTEQRRQHYVELDGVLCRSSVPMTGDLKEDSVRPILPASMRKRAFHNHHTSVYGAHLGARATLVAVARRYWWPDMSDNVKQWVRDCTLCATAKTTQPSRQGLLRSRVYSGPLDALGMDVMGPLHTAAARRYTYLWVAYDPFSHRLWLQTLPKLSGEAVVEAFVNRILLQWGAPRSIVTDNGREFDNKHMREAMRLLKVHHEFTPPYHPRSNFTERVNRFIGATLRALVNSAFAQQEDWGDLVPYVEFAYNSMMIPGTDVSPFMLTTGRQPLLPSDIHLLPVQPLEQDPLNYHEALLERLARAQTEVKLAHERAQAENAANFNDGRQPQSFEAGDTVLYYRLEKREDQASKLLMRNQLWQVIGPTTENSNIYDIRCISQPTRTTRAHVDQLTLFTGRLEPLEAEGAVSDGGYTLKDLRQNRHIVFLLAGDPPAHVRVAEVIDISEGTLSVELWHYIHKQRTAKYDHSMPLAARRLEPEWFNKTTGESMAGTPKPQQAASYERLTTTYRVEGANPQIRVVVPSFVLETGGKVPKEVCRKAELWIHEQQPSAAEAAEGSCQYTQSGKRNAVGAIRLHREKADEDSSLEVLVGEERRRAHPTEVCGVEPPSSTEVGGCKGDATGYEGSAEDTSKEKFIGGRLDCSETYSEAEAEYERCKQQSEGEYDGACSAATPEPAVTSQKSESQAGQDLSKLPPGPS